MDTYINRNNISVIKLPENVAFGADGGVLQKENTVL